MDYGDESYLSGDDSVISAEETPERTVEGAPIDEDALAQFLGRGRSIKAVSHPYLSTGLAWISTATKGKDTSSVSNSDFKPIESSVFQLPDEYTGSFAQQRSQLTSDCAELYEELQSSYNEDLDAEVDKMVSAASRQYRHRISKTLEELSRVAEGEGLSEVDEVWQQTLFDTIAVWQCAEAIYMPLHRDSLLCDGLMDWVNRMDPRPTQQDGEDIMTTRKPYLHPGFWDYVSKGILRGLFEMVGTCLQNSGLSEVDSATSRATNDLCLLLRTCPRAVTYPTNVQDFKDRHRVWRAKVLRASKELNLADQEVSAAFRQVYELLRGDKDAVYRQSDSWQECLAALALLFDPSGLRAAKDVRALFEMVTESDDFGLSVDRTLPSEEACAAFCGELIPKAITKSKSVDLSLAALLSDLLDKVEVLEDIRSGELDLTIREVLALALGDACITEPTTWKAAVTYWRSAGEVGIDSVQQVLPRIPIRTQLEVDEILSICHDLEMFDEASEIETVWARQLENQGKYNDAINAYDRAENARQIDRLNWVLFEQSLLLGKPFATDAALADVLQSPQNTSSSRIAVLMAPYATLSMFYYLKTTNDQVGASTHLAALLKSPDMPKNFLAVLMAEMLPLLGQVQEATFNLRDIFDILAAIEDFVDSDQYAAGLELLSQSMKRPAQDGAGMPDWRAGLTERLGAQDVISLLRLQISRYMAARFLRE